MECPHRSCENIEKVRANDMKGRPEMGRGFIAFLVVTVALAGPIPQARAKDIVCRGWIGAARVDNSVFSAEPHAQ